MFLHPPPPPPNDKLHSAHSALNIFVTMYFITNEWLDMISILHGLENLKNLEFQGNGREIIKFGQNLRKSHIILTCLI